MARFPYQFAKWEFSIALGWFSVFALLCMNIDRILEPDKRVFHGVEHKEKFGRPWWISTHRNSKKSQDDEIRLMVRNFIDASRSKARRTCI